MRIASLPILLVSAFLLSSAAPDPNPLFDEYYTSIGIKAENARLDNYAIQLRNAPTSRGVIVVYAETESSAKSAQARARRAVEYVVNTRGLSASKVVWRYEAACGREHILLFLLNPDQSDPPRDTKCRRSGVSRGTQ